MFNKFVECEKKKCLRSVLEPSIPPCGMLYRLATENSLMAGAIYGTYRKKLFCICCSD